MQRLGKKADLLDTAQERSVELRTQIKDATAVAAHSAWQLMCGAAGRLRDTTKGGRSRHLRAKVRTAAAETVRAGRSHPGRVAGTAAGALAAVAALRQRRRRSHMTPAPPA